MATTVSVTVNLANNTNAFSGREVPTADSFDIAGAVVSVLAAAISTAQANSTTITGGSFSVITE